jgi:hypothetical protein
MPAYNFHYVFQKTSKAEPEILQKKTPTVECPARIGTVIGKPRIEAASL